jgi:hypothetical protein
LGADTGRPLSTLVPCYYPSFKQRTNPQGLPFMATTAFNISAPPHGLVGVYALGSVVTVLIFAPTSSRADVAPPRKEITKGNKTLGNLNDALEGLRSGDRVSITLFYRDSDQVEVRIPKKHQARAAKLGLPITLAELSDAKPVGQQIRSGQYGNVVIGFALAACCITAGIWLARRKSNVLLILLLVTVAGVGGVLTFLTVYSVEPTSNSPKAPTPTRPKPGVLVVLRDDDDRIDVFLPLRLRPEWMGNQVETAYPSPFRPRPRRFTEKK